MTRERLARAAGALALACAPLGAGLAAYPGEGDPLHRAGRGRRHRGHRRAHARRPDVEEPRPADRGREPAERELARRHAGGGPGRAGRLHAAHDLDDVPVRAGDRREPRLRPDQGLRPGHADVPRADDGGGEPERAGEVAGRAGRAREVEAGRDHHRELGQRLDRPHGGGALRVPRRRQVQQHLLQGQRAGAHRRRRRPDDDALRPDRHHRAAGPRRQAAGDRGHHPDALAALSRYPDDRGVGLSGVRGRDHQPHARAGRNAARHRQSPPRGGRQGVDLARSW